MHPLFTICCLPSSFGNAVRGRSFGTNVNIFPCREWYVYIRCLSKPFNAISGNVLARHLETLRSVNAFADMICQRSVSIYTLASQAYILRRAYLLRSGIIGLERDWPKSQISFCAGRTRSQIIICRGQSGCLCGRLQALRCGTDSQLLCSLH